MTRREAGVVLVLIAAYFVAAMRASGAIVLAGVGIVAFVLAWKVPFDRVWTDRKTLPILVSTIAILAFAVPVGALPSPRASGFLAAGIGVLAFESLWATRQYAAYDTSSGPQRTFIANLRWGISWGIGLAAGMTVVVSVLFVAFGTKEPAIRFVIGGYFMAGLAGGIVAGVVRPLTRRTLGLMFVGILVAAATYGVIGFAARFIDSPSGPVSVSDEVLFALIAGIAVGPPAAFGLRESRLSAERRLPGMPR